MDDKFPALRLLLETERLYPDERLEIVSLQGRVARLEHICAELCKDAEALVEALDRGGPEEVAAARNTLCERVS